jgi:ATP-dependent Clp protease adapter protein ClpS
MDAAPNGPQNNPHADPPPHRTVQQLPPWRLILHDDEVSEKQHVIAALAAALPLSRAAAAQRVLQAHRDGVATVLETHRELAELYYLQLSKRNLIVSIERA